jgi:hypothetical protein
MIICKDHAIETVTDKATCYEEEVLEIAEMEYNEEENGGNKFNDIPTIKKTPKIIDIPTFTAPVPVGRRDVILHKPKKVPAGRRDNDVIRKPLPPVMLWHRKGGSEIFSPYAPIFCVEMNDLNHHPHSFVVVVIGVSVRGVKN